MAMNIGYPVAFFVSEPRLWATVVILYVSCQCGDNRVAKCTPSNDETNNRIRCARDAEDREIAYMHVSGNEQQ